MSIITAVRRADRSDRTVLLAAAVLLCAAAALAGWALQRGAWAGLALALVGASIFAGTAVQRLLWQRTAGRHCAGRDITRVSAGQERA